MKDNIACLYESMYKTSKLTLIKEIDVSTTGAEDSEHNIEVVNIYIRPGNGPIQRPYSGTVVNSTRLEGNYTVIAQDEGSNKLIQVILLDDGDISVNIQDDEGRIQDTFMGKNLDFYDTDSGKKELNVIKIESV